MDGYPPQKMSVILSSSVGLVHCEYWKRGVSTPFSISSVGNIFSSAGYYSKHVGIYI